MHCPSCGNESSLDQKFCRQCGFGLEVVGKLLSEDRPTSENLELEQVSDEKLALRHMVRWMMWGLLVALVGVIVTVVNKQFLADRLASLIGVLIMLGGVSITTYGVLDAMRGGGSRSKKPQASDDLKDRTDAELSKADTTKQLAERIPVPVPSVTERTTQLIAADIKNDEGE